MYSYVASYIQFLIMLHVGICDPEWEYQACVHKYTYLHFSSLVYKP